MLASLRLDGFVGCDYQQHKVNAADAGQHVADETLVAGDIDEAEAQSFAAGSGKFKMCETDVDGDATALFFLEAVGVDAGEGLDQRGLAVVDVASGADDDGLHETGMILEAGRRHSPSGNVQKLIGRKLKLRAPKAHATNRGKCDNRASP